MAEAIDVRDLDDAVDVAAVLCHRLQRYGEVADGTDGLREPFSTRELDDTAYAPAMRQVAQRMDARIVELGERAAENPPEWAVAFGPVPDDAVGRLEWTDRAATVASYREAFGIAGAEPIGEAPPPARPEARRWWNAAREALAGETQPTAWASDAGLAERVAAGDRAELERPDPAGLEQAAKTERHRRAELAFALAQQQKAASNPDATVDDRADAQRRVDAARSTAQQAAGRLAEAEAGHDAYRAWEARTAVSRADAEAARNQLARRAVTGDRRDDLADLPTGWVAYQAVQAEQLLARKQRALASARSAIQRVAARAHQDDEPDDARSAEENQALLQRWEADETRLTQEVAAARITVERINSEVDRRPDGQEAKAAARATPTGRIPSQPAPATPAATPLARQQPPKPTI